MFGVPPLRGDEIARPGWLEQPALPTPPSAAGAQDIERQIGDLRRRLNITPAQQGQFDAFAQAMRQNAQDMTALAQQVQQNRNRNAVEDLRVAARFAEAEAEGLKRLVPAFQALYDSLSEQQKRIADQAFVPQAEPPDSRRR